MGNVESERRTRELLTTVRVEYSHRDGLHIYSSVQVPGLYVTGRNVDRAFDDIADAIALLLRLNEGIDVVAKPAADYQRFIEIAKAAEASSDERHTPTSASRQYILYERRHD